MTVYNVMEMHKYDYDFTVDLAQRGCFYSFTDAKKRVWEIFTKLKNTYADEIEQYGDLEVYPTEEDGGLYLEEDDVYCELSYGFDDMHKCHQVWIDELHVK